MEEKTQPGSIAFSPSGVYGDISRRTRTAVRGPIWLNLDLFQDFNADLVNRKNKKIKSKMKLIEFSGPGQIPPESLL